MLGESLSERHDNAVVIILNLKEYSMENFIERARAWAKSNPDARTILSTSNSTNPASSRHFGGHDSSKWQVGFHSRTPLVEVIEEWEKTKQPTDIW